MKPALKHKTTKSSHSTSSRLSHTKRNINRRHVKPSHTNVKSQSPKSTSPSKAVAVAPSREIGNKASQPLLKEIDSLKDEGVKKGSNATNEPPGKELRSKPDELVNNNITTPTKKTLEEERHEARMKLRPKKLNILSYINDSLNGDDHDVERQQYEATKKLIREKMEREAREKQKTSDSDDEGALFRMTTELVQPNLQDLVSEMFANPHNADKIAHKEFVKRQKIMRQIQLQRAQEEQEKVDNHFHKLADFINQCQRDQVERIRSKYEPT